MKIHHIGYAVPEIEEAVKVFEAALGYKLCDGFREKKPDMDRNVNVALMEQSGVVIELLEISDNSKSSPIDFLMKDSNNKYGGMPYHICYLCRDIENTILEMRRKRFLPLGKPAFSVIFGKKVVFLFHKKIGIIELIEE